MLFGNCANIIAQDGEALRRMKAAGFDFVEANLTAIAQAPDAAFDEACALVRAVGLSVPVCNCMFPSDVRIAGGDQNPEIVTAYLGGAFARAKRLGVQKVVLGSDKSRNLPAGYPEERGYADLIDIVRRCVVPACERHGITALIEPLRRPCNLINTLQEGMRVVRAADSPFVRLIADSIHVMTSGEDMDDLIRLKQDVLHVHISDWNRALPEFGYSSELTRFLNAMVAAGYDGTVSFEAGRGRDAFGLQRALLLLRQKLA